MKAFFWILLLLYIYTVFGGQLWGQNLKLSLAGKDSLETFILKQKNTPLIFKNFEEIESHVDSLAIQLQRDGFIAVEKKELLKKSDSLYHATFYLNTQVAKIHILNPEVIVDMGLTPRDIKNFATYTPENALEIDFPDIEQVLKSLTFKLSEMGDPFSRVKLHQLKPHPKDPTLLTAYLYIEKTNQRTVSSIVVKGYENFPTSFLKYSLGLKPKMLFQKQKITSQVELIDNLGFVKNIKPPEVLFTNNKTDLYVYLEKVPHNLFDGILGFSTNEETNALTFNGYLNLELRNNLNFGESLSLHYKNDGGQQELFKVAAVLPYLLKSPVGLEVGLELFKRDSTFLTVERKLNTHYRFDQKITAFAGYKDYESTYLAEETNTTSFTSDFTSRFFVVGGRFEIAQADLLFPTKSSFFIENALGKRNLQNKATQQYRLYLEGKHIIKLNSTHLIYLGNQTGSISSKDFVVNELFRFGGINSIRGFNENSIEASVYTVFNTEYRLVFNTTTFVHSIIDLGYFENPILQLQSKIYSFGVGLGLKSKAGLFKLNIANGSFENQPSKFSNTQIHISLLSKF